MRSKKTFLLIFFFLTSFIVIIPAAEGYIPPPVTVSLTRTGAQYMNGMWNILDTSLIPDTQFTINMTLDDIEPDLLWAYQISLMFNASVLNGVSVENGPFLGSKGGDVVVNPGHGFNNEEGTLGIYAAYLYTLADFPDGGSEEHGPLCTITFKVVGYGGSPITMGSGPPVGPTRLGNRTGDILIDKQKHPDRFIDAYFDNRPPVSVDPSTVEDVPVGGKFNVSVNVAEMEDLYSYELYLNWSAPVLNVTSIVEGDFLKSQPGDTVFHQEIHNDEGYIRVRCERTGTAGVSGGGTLANITFQVESIAKSTLHLYDTSLFAPDGNPLRHMTIDGFFNNVKIHDIAVTDVTASPALLEPGGADPVYINVTVENLGQFTETFNVTVYYGEEEIDTETDVSLLEDSKITLNFIWNVTDVRGGSYIIKAEASGVADDANTENNIGTFRSVVIILHDISIIQGATLQLIAQSGDSVYISILIKNEGSVSEENFNVTTYYNDTAIYTKVISKILQGEERSIMVIWNITDDVEPGLYLIWAATTDIPGEAEPSNNVRPIAAIEIREVSEQSLSSQIIIPVAVIAAVILSVSAVYIIFRRIRPSAEEAW